jgi:hypothetical protein
MTPPSTVQIVPVTRVDQHGGVGVLSLLLSVRLRTVASCSVYVGVFPLIGIGGGIGPFGNW